MALDGEALRSGLILATCLRFPHLIDTFEDRLERLEPRDPDHAALATALLRASARDSEALGAEISRTGLGSALERLRAMSHLAITPFLAGDGDAARAEDCLTEEFAKISAARAIEQELREAPRDLAEAGEDGDDGLAFRLNEAVRGRHEALYPRGDVAAEQFGASSAARDAFRQLLSTAGQGKKTTN